VPLFYVGEAPSRSTSSLDHMFGRALRFLGFYLALSLICAPILLLHLLPFRPRSALGWVILVVAAVPVTVLGELIGDFLLKNRISASVDHGTRGTSLSWIRIGYVLCVFISFVAVVFFGIWIWTRLVL
jgi:hypothetical protein